MARKKKRKRKSLLDDAKQPSDVLLSAHLRSGAGSHTESREERNRRTGRLQGAEKRRLRDGDYD